MKFDIPSLLIGLVVGIVLMVLYMMLFGHPSYYEAGSMFDSATTSDEVQKIYDEAVARLVNEANANIPSKNEGADVSKIGEDLQTKIADVSAAATKAFARVAPKTAVTASPAPAPEVSAPAPAPAPAPEVMAPQTSTYEVEPYH